MTVVVVSNRVARAKPDEPLAGGLAAALLPMVRDSGAIWVGSSGQCQRCSARIHSPRSSRWAPARWPPSTCRRSIIAAITRALPIRRCGRRCIRAPISSTSPPTITPPIARSTRFMARALLRFNKPEAVFWVQDYHFLTLGAELRRLGIERPLGFFLHTPWADRQHHGGGAASCRTGRRHAGLRSDRLPDRRRPAEFRRLSAGRARLECGRRHGRVAIGD